MARTFWVAVLALAGVAISVALMRAAQIDAWQWVLHGREVGRVARLAERRALDRETGIRGFLLTGDSMTLAPELSARRELPGLLDSLVRATADNPTQHRRARAIAAAVDEWERGFAAPALANPADDGRAAGPLAGKGLFDVVRQRFATFESAEDALYHARVARERRVRNATTIVILAELTVIGLALLWLRGRTVRQTRHLLEQQHMLEEQAVELEAQSQDLLHTNEQLASAIEQAVLARTAAEAATAELQGLLAAMTDVILVLDAAGTYLRIPLTNPRRLVRPPAEMLGRRMHDVLPRETADRLVAVIERTLAGGAPTQHEYAVPIAGETVWFAANVAPLGRDRVVWVARDVTEAKRNQVALAHSEERYRRVTELVPYGILIHSGGRIAFANPAASALLGAETPDALCGRDTFALLHPDSHEFVERRIEAINAGVIAPLAEVRMLRLDGSMLEVEATGIPFTHDGASAGLVVFHDIGPRKRLEGEFRQAQKMEAVGQLASGVAHDFNNLLTVMTSYSGMLLAELPPDHPARADLEEISLAADRAAVLTRQLLTFSRKQLLQPRPLDLNEVTRDVEKMLRRLIRADVRLRTELVPAVDRVLADPGQIEQIIVNLVVNARDAIADGGTITIETANVEIVEGDERARGLKPGAYVMLAVHDTGSGMSAETQARIFEPFFTTKDVGHGTGLGLSTVYGIVTQCGGHIVVDSELGRGTSMKIYLPRATTTAPEMRPRSGPYPAIRSGSGTVLLVEDEPRVRAGTRRILERAGYRVLDVPNGTSALDLFGARASEIELVITDMVMPEMSGRALADAVRLRRPDVGVLFMSGYTDDDALRQSLAESGSAFLQKPFTPETLMRKVREALEPPHA